jgi:hypothetical protein
VLELADRDVSHTAVKTDLVVHQHHGGVIAG